MTALTLKLELLTYWQAGSGRGADCRADSIVVRDRTGLPYLPGRTVKGLVRDAVELAEAAGAVPSETTRTLFGSGPVKDNAQLGDELEKRIEASRYTTVPGRLFFGSAVLPSAWRNWALQGRGRVPAAAELTTCIASTAIDRDGVAAEQTLRVFEVAVPMTLRGSVRGPDDGAWVQVLESALPLLRALGTRRHRGYGRVQVTLEAP